MDRSKYDIIIGLEIHIQTKTRSKMFCTCNAEYFGEQPNTHVCPVCLGLPGALPVPNKKALEKCILIGLATNCDIDKEVHFDRKHYFYPDLPKGYQISQYKRPICSDGYVEIKDENGEPFRVEIERIHQEEDVAKSTHHIESSTGKEYSLIDYNKSGVPLIEIVTKPNISSAYQAKAYASKIRQIARYLDISDADMEKGQMRCEPNISVQEKGKWEYVDGKIKPVGDYKLNPKVEIKNIGSISFVEKSIEYEVDRLIKDLEEGKEIVQQTRGWNSDKGITEFQRSKETAEDYRYMPEPDIPLIDITEEVIERVQERIVELPDEKMTRYISEYGLSEYDAGVLTANREISHYYEDLVSILTADFDSMKASKSAANWITGIVFSISNNMGIKISDSTIPLTSLAMLIREFESNSFTKNKAEELLIKSLEEKLDLEELIQEAKEEAQTSSGNLESIIDEVIESNPKAVEDYKAGKQASIGFLVGQVMQRTKGTADPNIARSILMERLNG